jgi:diacylglycerol kinase family enzyme
VPVPDEATSRPELGVIFSPGSGRAKRDPGLRERLAHEVGALGDVVSCRNVPELDAALGRFRDAKVIAICGGDGTNHRVLTRAYTLWGDAWPTFAFLRGGTMNTVANGLGLPRMSPERWVACLARELRARHAPGFVQRRMLRLETRAGVELAFIFGTGAVHGFLAEYYRDGTPSPWQAFKTLARGAVSAALGGETAARVAKPFRGSVTFPGHDRWPTRDYLAIAGGTVEQIGLGFRPFYRCKESPHGFHVLGIHTTPVGFVRALPRVFRGQTMTETASYEHITPSCEISSPEGEVSYMIDGDLRATEGTLRVALGPAVRVYCPARTTLRETS